MKIIFSILLITFLAGCIAKKETYLIIGCSDKVYVPSQTKRDTIYTNRFEKQFYQADSAFNNNIQLKFR